MCSVHVVERTDGVINKQQAKDWNIGLYVLYIQ